MTDVRFKPTFTQCTRPEGHQIQFIGDPLTRHSTMIMKLGKCRLCDETKLYAGGREDILEELSTAFLKLYVTEVDEAVWGIDDLFWEKVTQLSEEELPPEFDADDEAEVDYDTEGLRIIHEALTRAAGKIEAHLNAAGEDL